MTSIPALRSLQRAQSTLAAASWTCRRCQTRILAAQRWSSSATTAVGSQAGIAKNGKPYYITTPIFYVNAAPHIGHLYTMIVTDVFKRWQQLNGREAYLCTGTDEHGMKIQRAAAKEEVPPQEFCDDNSRKFRDLAKAANIANDFFIRTTDEEHKEAVREFWLQLKNTAPEDLGVYKGHHEGWYCVSDECFYPEDLVQPSIVPQTGRKIMASVETGSEVEWVKEETWFFPLSKYKQKLLDFYDANPDWIQPRSKQAEVRDWVENHLEDLSITRPASRLSWGIKDPEDSDQTIYVWVDALINYMTKAGYGSKWHSPKGDTGLWPADMHVVGKDIIRFHAIYWPALLMALGMPLPKAIFCHNHWIMSGRKMSKSIGNVVNPGFAIERWGIDPLRYLLLRASNMNKDMDYSNEHFATVYIKQLQANMGNLFNRVARPKAAKMWSTWEASKAFREGLFDPTKDSNDRLAELRSQLQEAPQNFDTAMQEYDASKAVQITESLLTAVNRYVTATEPWKLVKDPNDTDRAQLNQVIFCATEGVRIAAILLQPVMPNKMTELLNELGVRADYRTRAHAEFGVDDSYGIHPDELAKRPKEVAGKGKYIFPALAATDDDMSHVDIQSHSKNKVYRHVGQLESEFAKKSEGGERD